MVMKINAPPPPNLNRFLGHNQSEYFIDSGVCVGIYEAYPRLPVTIVKLLYF